MNERMLVVLIAGILVGVVGYALYQQYYAPAPAPTPTWQTTQAVANLEYEQEGTEFDFSAEVLPDGSVADKVTKDYDITIYNNDTRDASNVVITLANTINNRKGLPTELRIDDVIVSVQSQKGYVTETKYLYKDGKFNSLNIGTIPKDSSVTITFLITLDKAPEDTFEDGEEYEIELYVMQGSIAYDTIDFTLIT